MKKIPNVLISGWVGLLILTACSSQGESATPLAIPTPQQASVTKVSPLPTDVAPGNSIIWQNLQVTMEQAEISGDFITEYGFTRSPSAGEKFVWVHVQLKNMGQKQIDTPSPEHFGVLYAATELKPTYGHRKDYSDYTVLDPVVFPNQVMDAWLRFDIPVNAELKDLRFVFLPESSHVGVSFSSPNYPYAEDHPIYVWKCTP